MRAQLALISLPLVLLGCGSSAGTELPAKAKLPSGTEIKVSGNTRAGDTGLRVCGEIRGPAASHSSRVLGSYEQYCLKPGGPRGAEGHVFSSSEERDDGHAVLVLPDRGYTARFVGRRTSRDAALIASPKGDSHAVVAVVAFAAQDLPGRVIVTSGGKRVLVSDEIQAGQCPRAPGGGTMNCDSQIHLTPRAADGVVAR